jgi:hypothetical protein
MLSIRDEQEIKVIQGILIKNSLVNLKPEYVIYELVRGNLTDWLRLISMREEIIQEKE